MWLQVLPGPVGLFGEAWPTCSAFEYARNEVNRVHFQREATGEAPPTTTARRRLLSTLREAIAADSVYPSVSDDGEGGLIAEWRAGDRRLQLDVTAEGEELVTVRLRNGPVLYRGSSVLYLRSYLRDLTSYINDVNPGWQRLFRMWRRPPQGEH
jgi:hypothetical protein